MSKGLVGLHFGLDTYPTGPERVPGVVAGIYGTDLVYTVRRPKCTLDPQTNA